MTELRLPGSLGSAVAAMLATLLVLAGCGTAAPGRQPLPVAATPERPADAEPQASHAESAATIENGKAPNLDEKSVIYFSLGSSAIGQDERSKLRDIAEQLKVDKTKSVQLIGYANDNGSSSFNLAVADSRVQSVGAALKKLGVKPQQIRKHVVGGEKHPVACRSAECQRKMRRVELVISAAH